MIPKKIHYIWFGKKNKNKLTEICINSWKRTLTDYEIIEWNEKNLNIGELCKSNRFLKKCYELKLWAFVSDYLRLYILYNEGGIYLDTDVEVLKKYDELLNNKVFMGFEEGGYIGTSVIGAEKHNPLIKRLLNFYDNEIWNVDFYNNPIIYKFLLEKEPEIFRECTIYEKEYFSPYTIGKEYTSSVEENNTYSIHWYTNNWNLTRRAYIFLNTKHLRFSIYKILQIIRKSIGYSKMKGK